MASVINLPSAPNTGLTSLANVLLGSATEYAGQKQADKTEARRRAERLADIDSERKYSELNYDRARADRLSDIGSERADKDTREARKRDEQLEDIDAARYWEKKIRNQGGEEAQVALNQLTENEAAVMARMTEREKRLSAPEPQPTRDQVMPRALALARQSSGKNVPPTAEIEAAIPMAMEEARTVLNQAWQRDRLDAQESQRIDSSLLNRISAEKNVITNIFRKVGVAQPTPLPPEAYQAPDATKKDAAAVRAYFANQITGNKTGANVPVETAQTPDNFKYQGGVLGGLERGAAAVSKLGDLPGYLTRQGEAVGRGFLTGDYSVPAQSRVERIGESIGTSLSDIYDEGQKNVEDAILRDSPYSDRAKAIRVKRGMAPIISIPAPTPIITLPPSP